MKRFATIALATAVLFLAGCGHYRITDPATGNDYYTKSVKEERSGAVRFKDQKTGAKMTLQNSSIQKIKSSEYKAGLKD